MGEATCGVENQHLRVQPGQTQGDAVPQGLRNIHGFVRNALQK
jgi:hypothetical protein